MCVSALSPYWVVLLLLLCVPGWAWFFGSPHLPPTLLRECKLKNHPHLPIKTKQYSKTTSTTTSLPEHATFPPVKRYHAQPAPPAARPDSTHPGTAPALPGPLSLSRNGSSGLWTYQLFVSTLPFFVIKYLFVYPCLSVGFLHILHLINLFW